MSSMLEQAIIDAATLREAALKNAEQSVIEKYAPEIKAAVDSLLEGEENIINEVGEMGSMATSAPPPNPIEAPFAAADINPEKTIDLGLQYEFSETDFLDLEKLQQVAEEEGLDAVAQESTEELLDDLETEDPTGAPKDAVEIDDQEIQLQEIIDMLSDSDEILEEELEVDLGETKAGWITTSEGELKYQQEMRLAKEEATQFKEENKELADKVKELKESVDSFQIKNKELYSAVKQLKNRLDESLLSNAKLIYSNRILGDASLNERQKDKIVEAIAKAKNTDEAKALCETLKATVGTTKDSGPKSLSESVQRKSNLSSILPRRKKEMNENATFSDRMKKLAGIS